MISKVEFVTIDVADQQRARDFYTQVLGFELVTDAPMGGPEGPRWIEVRPKGGSTRVVLQLAEQHTPGFAPCVFGTEDIQATHAELTAKGVEFTAAPKLEAWGSWWAQLKDSEGNELGLGQSTEEGQ